MALSTLEQIKKANEKGGYTYFSKGNVGRAGGVSGFSSRFLSPILSVPHGAVFVESTKAGPQHPRRYTVLYIEESTGDVRKLSEFQEYRSATGAKGRAKREQERLRAEQS